MVRYLDWPGQNRPLPFWIVISNKKTEKAKLPDQVLQSTLEYMTPTELESAVLLVS